MSPREEAPRAARWLLERVLPADVRDDVMGDLEEVYRSWRADAGAARARMWYAREALSFSLRFGWERVRDAAGVIPGHARRRWLASGLWLEFKLGLRMLLKYPGLTVVGGLAIAIAVAFACAWFQFATDYVNRTLPFDEGDRIVGIRNWNAATSSIERRSLHDFVAWRDQLESVDDVGAFTDTERNLITDDGRAEPVRIAEISASAFRVVRMRPLLGRALLDADEQAGAPHVAVIGHDVWQSRFGGDPRIIGQSIRLGGSWTTIVGVMPAGFAFPIHHDLWVPLRLNPLAYERLQGPGVGVFGRLAPGATREHAQAELDVIGMRASADFPDTHGNLRPQVLPYVESLFGMRVLVQFVNGAFILLLVIASLNVATLVFARTAMRESEIVVRSALGANRARIVLQLFIEAFALAGVAAAVGFAAADWGMGWGMELFWRVQGARAPFWWSDGLASGTLLYAAALTVLGTLIVGVVPALKMTARTSGLHHPTASGSNLRFGGMWTVVIVTQVALSVAFLPTTIYMARDALVQQSSGFVVPAQEYLTVRLGVDADVPPSAMTEAQLQTSQARFAQIQQELARRIATETGSSVTFASALPGMDHPRVWALADAPTSAVADENLRSSIARVDAMFFDAFGTSMLAGRAFQSADFRTDAAVVIVNQSFARKLFGTESPVGRRMRFYNRPGEDVKWLEVVGVVKDLDMNPGEPGEPAGFYVPSAPGVAHSIRMAVHVGPSAESFAPRLRQIVGEVDPTLRLYDLQSLDAVVQPIRQSVVTFSSLFALLAAIALLLSAAGTYALMSFTVSRRTREIGIRAALGGRPRRIVGSVFSRAFLQLGLGALVGILISAYSLSEDLANEGPGLLLGVIGFLMLVGLLACAAPAARALRIQPTEALKE